MGCGRSMEEIAAIAGGLSTDQFECRDGGICHKGVSTNTASLLAEGVTLRGILKD